MHEWVVCSLTRRAAVRFVRDCPGRKAETSHRRPCSTDSPEHAGVCILALSLGDPHRGVRSYLLLHHAITKFGCKQGPAVTQTSWHGSLP